MSNGNDLNLTSLLDQLKSQKEQVDGVLSNRNSANSERLSNRNSTGSEKREVVKEESKPLSIAPPVPAASISTKTSSNEFPTRKTPIAAPQVPSIRLANGDRFQLEDLQEMLPTIEWVKLFKSVENAAQGRKPRESGDLNNFEDELASLRSQVEEMNYQAHEARTREVRLLSDVKDRDEKLSKVAGSTLLACLDLQNSLERVASLKMSGQKVQAASGPVVQLRMPVENECLKELDACRSRVKHLELSASAIAPRGETAVQQPDDNEESTFRSLVM